MKKRRKKEEKKGHFQEQKECEYNLGIYESGKSSMKLKFLIKARQFRPRSLRDQNSRTHNSILVLIVWEPTRNWANDTSTVRYHKNPCDFAISVGPSKLQHQPTIGLVWQVNKCKNQVVRSNMAKELRLYRVRKALIFKKFCL